MAFAFVLRWWYFDVARSAAARHIRTKRQAVWFQIWHYAHLPMFLGIGVAVWSLLTAASGMAWSYATLFAARVGVGIGEANCAPASSSLIADLYPAEERARALSFFMLGLPLGTFFGSLVSGRLAAAYGWRVPFYVACAPGLVLALLALRIPEPPRGAAEAAPLAGRPDKGSPYWRVLRIPTIRWLIISGALFNFNMYTISTFLPALLSRYHGLNLKEANAVAAIVLGAVGIPGLLLGGWGADYALRDRSNGRCCWLQFPFCWRHFAFAWR